MNKAKNQDQRILMCGACGKHKKVCCWKIDIVCKKRDEPNPNIPEGHMAYLRKRKMWASDLELLHSENPEKYPAQGQVVELYPNEPVELYPNEPVGLYPNEPVKPRKCVRDFAMVMEEKLRENDHKSKGDDRSPWLRENFYILMEKLKIEVDELSVELDNVIPGIADKDEAEKVVTNISRESADIANYAMMIKERCEYLKKCLWLKKKELGQDVMECIKWLIGR